MEEERSRILVLIKGLGIGGAEKLITEGARFWDGERFEYSVGYVLPWKDQLVPELEGMGIPVHCLGGRRGLSPALLTRLRRLIRSRRIDLVHAHLPTMGIAARIASPVPVVYTEHNIAPSYRLPTRIINRMTYGRNRAVIAVSGAVGRTVESYPGPPAIVIPNGVACRVEPQAAQQARQELGLGPDAPVVAHVGNIRPGKGHDVLIDAAAILQQRRPDVTIVSIGGEKYPGDLERVRERAEQAGLGNRLRFLGRRPDALDFVAAADLFCNPSTVEGLPVAVLEAMALGRPVVATAAGGVPGIVKNDETGFLVEPEDPRALATAIERLLGDRARAKLMGEAARALVESEYGLEPMIRATEDVYRQVLHG